MCGLSHGTRQKYLRRMSLKDINNLDTKYLTKVNHLFFAKNVKKKCIFKECSSEFVIYKTCTKCLCYIVQLLIFLT